MKKRIAFSVRVLIAVSLGVLIGVGWLLFKDFARARGGYSFFYVYRENGTLEKEVCFKDGEFERITKKYSSNGTLEDEWFNDGSFRRYSDNGKVKYELLKNKNDPEIKTIKTYYEDGRLATKHVYRRGRLLDKKGKPFNGVYQYSYQNGSIRKEETYKDGRMNGPWREYYKNGNLKFEFITAEGNRYVSGKSYYEGGQIKGVIEQRPGGPVMVKYDLAGNPISEYNMSNP